MSSRTHLPSALFVTLASSTLLLSACGAEQTPDTDAPATVAQPSAVNPDPAAEQGGGNPELGTPVSSPEGTPDPTVVDDPAPEGTDTIAALIRARHTEDLPTPEQLAALPDAAGTLLWLERNATHMFERTRTLTLMRHTPTDAVRARLTEVAGNEDEADVARRAAQESLGAIAE